MNSPLQVLLTTDPGIEVTVRDELLEKASRKGLSQPRIRLRPTGHSGTVEAVFPEDSEAVRKLLFELRSVHHVMKELGLFQLPNERSEQLKALREWVAGLEVPEFKAAPESSFRVSCDRLGKHDFSSMDVLKEAGAAIQEHYGLPVDLEGFRYHFRVDIYENSARCGLQWTRKPLSKRSGRPFLPRIALKGNIAYALLRTLEADENEEGPLLDPFCGSGTLLLEAAHIFPSMKLYGSDNYPQNLPGAKRNFEALGVEERIELQELDARDLSQVHTPGSFRYIATNPPYGLRLGSGMNFHQLYSKFLAEAAKLLRDDGRMTLIVMKRGLFRRILEESGKFRTLEERELVMGRIHTWLYVLERS